MILTPRLRLRALTTRDLALFRALYCDRGTMRHIGKPLSRSVAAISLRLTVAATRKPGGLQFFVIAERRSRRGVGMCSLRPAAWDERGVEAGLMLLPAARGRGYAREALQGLIDAGFSNLHVDTVWVQHSRANEEMGHLSLALGFRPVRRKIAPDREPDQIIQLLRRPRTHSSTTNARKKNSAQYRCLT